MDERDSEGGEKRQGLTISSFFHHTFTYYLGVGYLPDFPLFAADQVGHIRNIGDIDPASFDFETDYEKLTDPTSGPPTFNPPNTTWPNNALRAPDGVLPFEGLLILQGFHPTPAAGRLTIVDVATLEEHIVHEAALDPPCGVDDEPRFFHMALFYDMDDDGLLDVVTVRSGFKALPEIACPPLSELVCCKSPGDAIQPDEQWDEMALFGGMGPNICLAMHNFDGDGAPEIIATHFFTGNASSPPTKGKIVMCGAPFGGSWSEVDGKNLPRVKLINESQGFPFSIEIVDLNGNGKMEILATNHQPNCLPFPGAPGQVYALEQPASGDMLNDDWAVQALLDGALPQPMPPVGARGARLAPGHATPFHPKKKNENSRKRPWILVSGDEAGKAWMMKPKGGGFSCDTAVIFDINDYYGEDTTQTFTSKNFTISTIGEPAIRYDTSKKSYL